MNHFNDQVFIEAIKKSKSPKLAYNGAKLLYEGKQSFSHVGKEVLDIAWADAAAFNRAAQRKKGKLRRKERYTLDQQGIKSEVGRIIESKDPVAELSRILIELDEPTLQAVYERISHLFG